MSESEASQLATQTHSDYSHGASTAATTGRGSRQCRGEPVRFHGCYLLMSLKRPRTYVGFTVNPSRRIRQHNGELPRGGAVRTSVNRPWRMVAIVHGFFSSGQALQFEWAWQNPHKSKCLKLHCGTSDAIPLRMKLGRPLQVHQQLAVLASLLSVPPWSHCPLAVTVLVDIDLWKLALGSIKLPDWTRVRFQEMDHLGDINDYDYGRDEPPPGASLTGPCGLCSEDTGSARRGSLCVGCGMTFHLHCLAAVGQAERDEQLPAGALLPSSVTCPKCKRTISWAEVVRFARVVRRSGATPPANTDTSRVGQ